MTKKIKSYWKKAGALGWSTTRTPLPKGVFSEEEIGLKSNVLIIDPAVYADDKLWWVVKVGTPFFRETIEIEDFKTKTQALKFAKSFMKKYPKGK